MGKVFRSEGEKNSSGLEVCQQLKTVGEEFYSDYDYVPYAGAFARARVSISKSSMNSSPQAQNRSHQISGMRGKEG